MSHYKPYPAYKDSGVEWLGMVPEHWDVRKLKWLASLQSGDFITSETIEEEGAYPVYGGNGLRGYCTAFTHEGAYSLVGRQGALCGNINYADGKFWASEHAVVVSPYVPTAVRWLGELLRAMNLGQYSISSAQPGLAVERIIDLFLPVPPESERQIIAVYVSRETAHIDALIEKKTRFIELLREKRQALIINAVTKGLDPNVKMKASGVEWLGEVPEHWNVLQLRHTARLESGHTPSRSKPEYWVDCTVPWFTLADVWQVRSGEQKYVSETSEKVSQLGLENSSARLLPAGSVFLSRTASVGFPGIMAVDMATSQDFAVWTCTSELFNEYLYYVLLAMKPDFDRLMMGSTHKTIYMPDIEAIRLARPPVDEQRGIVSALSGQLGRFKIVIDKTERSIELLKEHRSALITSAVTGQIDLREAV
ncbi:MULTISPECIES: restriction endonuclease subunit S [Pseudomonas]|jgi:type I restriction enzyme S subunit|uniref:restriction endonuclease subunit S n=1 Tax=Pseudomonas TaxID=286 RepID=UPI001C432BD4|nr:MULTISPECIES: restriction endonuclease subunit S [Pseudomonas]WLH58122.1 restriction endonuclease subunit S [Pseudomonas sp. FP2294]